MIWVIWKDTAAKAGVAPSTLKYIFRSNVDNSDTKYIMERVAGMPDEPASVGNLKMPFPGRTYPVQIVLEEPNVNVDNGLALLGTPHGTGAAFLQINNFRELGRRL